MTYNVSLENFQGPLDLLLFLVRKNEIEIEDIPIITITEQYMEYIDMMKALNLDVAGEFLVMAATLMYLKSRALLPRTDGDEAEEEQTTLEDLKRQLLEYEQYKDVAQRLKEQNILEKNVFTRACFNEPVPVDDEQALTEASVFDLLQAFKKMLERVGGDEAGYEVEFEQISVKDKMSDVLQLLEGHMGGLPFERLFSENPGKVELITTFLAMLELMKMQAIRIYQNANFSSIYVYPIGDEEQQGEAVGDSEQL